MGKRERFAANLNRRLSGLSPPLVAMEQDKRFWRWMTEGIERPTRATMPDLDKLRRYFGMESVSQFWMDSSDVPDYAEKLRVLLTNPLLSKYRERLCCEVDLLLTAVMVISRLHQEHAAVWEPAVKTVGESNAFSATIKALRNGKSADETVDAALEWARKTLSGGD